MATLDPEVVAWLLKRNQGATPDAPTDAPPLDAPPPMMTNAPALDLSAFQPQQIPQGLDYKSLGDAAQRDAREFAMNKAANLMHAGASNIANNDQVYHAPLDANRNVRAAMLQRQGFQGDVEFKQAQALKGLEMGLRAQQYDPNSAVSQAAVFAAQRAGHNIPPGTPAYLVGSYLSMLKQGVEPSKALAEIGQIGATTSKTVAEIPEVNARTEKTQAETGQVKAATEKTQAEIPEVLARTQKTQAEIPGVYATTAKTRAEVPLVQAQAAKTASEVGIEGERVNIEKGKIAVELAKWTSEHPDSPAPGVTWKGAGLPPARDSEPVKQIQDKVASTLTVKQKLAEYRDLINRTGRTGKLVGEDAAKLDSLYADITGQMGRLVSGGRMAEYDVVISQGKLPKSTSLKAIASPNGVANANAVIDQLSRLADKEVENYAGAHQFQVDTGSLKVNGGGAKPDAAARAAELKAQGVPRDEAIRKMQEEGYK